MTGILKDALNYLRLNNPTKDLLIECRPEGLEHLMTLCIAGMMLNDALNDWNIERRSKRL